MDHDACGVGMVADLSGRRTHEVVDLALTVVEHLEHRGASGEDPNSGDGAGILLAMPDALLRGEFAARGSDLPAPGTYAAGCVMVPKAPGLRKALEQHLAAFAAEEGLSLIHI